MSALIGTWILTVYVMIPNGAPFMRNVYGLPDEVTCATLAISHRVAVLTVEPKSEVKVSCVQVGVRHES